MTTSISGDFFRVATVTPELKVADVSYNSRIIKSTFRSANELGAQIALFPELGITGYTCADLFAQSQLLQSAKSALAELAEATAEIPIHAVVGLPMVVSDRNYNCAAFIGEGRILGIVPKQFLPNNGEYYEERWFTSGAGIESQSVEIAGHQVAFGTNLLFEDRAGFGVIGIEVCEDLWATQPPSGKLCEAGANLILNPSASNELLGKAEYRRNLVQQQSARCLAAYAYAASGPGESSTDLVFSGHGMIAENGVLIAELDRFQFESQIICADIDLQRLRQERITNSSFSSTTPCSVQRIAIQINAMPPEVETAAGSLRPNPARPFVPTDPKIRAETCREIFAIQSTGLAKRLKHTGCKNVVIGISGGLDSTLALLVVVRAFDLLGLDRRGILAPTMPGFGTTKRTRSNAEEIVDLLGATPEVIPIEPAVRQHFKDIGHDSNQHDVTFENSQARERTQILMDLANRAGGFVVGTGDLSESALGWCTFNGDHMSMYHVNAGVPKTLVRYLIEWCADSEYPESVSKVLHDIIDTPISPELLPTGAQGEMVQQTEDVVGPYELHDFFLFHMIRHGCRPSKILYLAEMAFAGSYDRPVIIQWLGTFIRRFFSQQFKRSSMPDGPKVGSVALSPRGDWRMPSDACAADWLAELDAIK